MTSPLIKICNRVTLLLITMELRFSHSSFVLNINPHPNNVVIALLMSYENLSHSTLSDSS